MKSVLLDLVEEPWLAAHGRDIVILVIMALVATAAIAGIFIWRKKQKRTK
jgi:hypothetical protein